MRIQKRRIIMIKLTNFNDLRKYFDVPEAAMSFLLGITESTENGSYPFGEDCVVKVMDCTTKEGLADMEAHNIYVDVQCLFSGEERIYYTDRAPLTATTELNTQKDVIFYGFVPSPYVDYKAGECVILYPEEAHLPSRAVNAPLTAKKAVVKLNCEKLRKN